MMKKKRQLILLAILLSAAALGAAAQTPEAIIKEVYAIHARDIKAGGEDRIINGKNRRYLDKFFEKNLADLIWEDLTTERDDIGVIDADLFYGGQDDPRITALRVQTTKITGKQAMVRVTFNNWGTKNVIIYQMVRTDQGWKISDIKFGAEDSLLKMFKEAKSNV
jgi:ABC-type transporter MlaC component